MSKPFWDGFEKQAAFGLNRLPASVAMEIQKANAKEGLGFFAAPILGLAKKFIGNKKSMKGSGVNRVVNAIKTVQKPFLHADIEVGHHLGKLPGLKNLFSVDEKVRAGANVYKKVRRASALGPVTKAVGIAQPIVFGMAVNKAGEDWKKKRRERKALEQQMRTF
jgi:hypothetical protein